jgi:hypothetical protein
MRNIEMEAFDPFLSALCLFAPLARNNRIRPFFPENFRPAAPLLLFNMKCLLSVFLLALVLAPAGLVLAIDNLASGRGARAEYMGGTIALVREHSEGRMQTTDEACLVFRTKKSNVRVPYDRINLLEYGQKVDRRIGAAIVLSPLFLLSKEHKHFLTIGFADDEGQQQAMVFQVDKDDVRAVLVSLEARTGRKVQYQDEEARKGGKG